MTNKELIVRSITCNAKADGNICKTYDNSAKAEKLKAYTGEEPDYIDHLKEWSI